MPTKKKGNRTMLTVILTSIIAGFSTFRNGRANSDRVINTVTATLFSGLFAFMMVFFISATSLIPSRAIPVREESFQLVATTTSSSISGSFFILSGSIDTKFYYLYYWQDNSDGIHFDKVNMNNAVIHEVDGTAPRLVITETVKEFDAPFNLFAMSFWDSRYKYDFYVPVGSVNREINMSLP